MDTEKILNEYKEVINYEVSRILFQHSGLWDDAVQETFIRIHKSMQSILEKQDKHRENYIRVIARNAARNVLKNELKQSGKNISLDEWKEKNLDNGVQMFAGEQLSVEMDACLKQLSGEERDFIFLRFIENFGYKEIARAMGLKEPACRQRVSRAKIHLQKVLEQNEEGHRLLRGRIRYEKK